MAKLNRVVGLEGVAGWSLSKAAAKAGWIVISGPAPRRKFTSNTSPASGLRLVDVSSGLSKYEPVSATAGMTPRWIQAIWLGSVLVSGWALYLVSTSG